MWNFIAVFDNIPLPPTINKAYSNIPGKGRSASKELTAFKRAFKAWAVLNMTQLRRAATEAQRHKIRLDIEITLPEERIFTRTGAPKRFDVSNRIKFIEDAICEGVGTDDKYVWHLNATKSQGLTTNVAVTMYKWY